jgi:hypothetical protein
VPRWRGTVTRLDVTLSRDRQLPAVSARQQQTVLAASDLLRSRDFPFGGVTVDDRPTDDRERRLIEAVVSLAKSFREERDRLARRLSQLEQEMVILSIRLDAQQRAQSEAVPPADPPPGPSRKPS